MRRLQLPGVAFVLGAATVTRAHVPETGDGLGTGMVIGLLALAALAYGTGLMRLLAQVHARREIAWRAFAFAVGWTTLATALLSPLDAMAVQSFALHMLQHELLMLVAAPLLVLGRGLPTMLWSLPHDARVAVGRTSKRQWLRRAWDVLTSPLCAWLLHAAALWLWHIPRLFNAALVDSGLHDWQHVSFLLTALIFWHALLKHGGPARRGAAVFYLFTTTVHTGVLGALLTFARTPLYAPFDTGLRILDSLTPLEDQQLGGLIMWVPGALVYVGAALALMASWLKEEPPSRRTIA